MTQGQSQVKVLSIKKFSEVCRTTPRTLRLYEKLGLLTPSKRTAWNNYRYYSPSQAKDFLQIKLMQNFHIPLVQIALAKKTKPGANFLNEKLASLKHELSDKQKQVAFLETFKTFLFGSKNPFIKRVVGPFNLFVYHVEHGGYDEIPQYIQHVRKLAKKLNISFEESEILFYPSEKYAPKNSPLDIALIVLNKPKQVKLPENFSWKTLPKMTALVYSYTGPYEYLTLVYTKLSEFITQKKIVVQAPFDIYTVGPTTATLPFDFVTEIVFPVN